MDTFGETYHFETLHRNTLAANFYGNVQCYDVFERNHRMVLCMQSIDALRGTPESGWKLTDGAFPVYYLFPNVQLNVSPRGLIMVRVYPASGEPGRSISRVSFYLEEELLRVDPVMVAERLRFFGDVIRDEDYKVAEGSQRSAESGQLETLLFGRNEPALHHYHNTYRAALGMPPLELIEA